jgi:Trypsin
MYTWRIALIVSLIIIVSSRTAFAQIVMKPAAPASGNELIINGTRKADPHNWPATFWFTSLSTKIECTSTVVGPRAVLTAAHCIGDTDEKGKIESGSFVIDITCKSEPNYTTDDSSPNTVYDIALCVAEADIPILFGGSYERIGGNSDVVPVGQDILLLGFGCRQKFGGGPRGELWEGTASRIENKNNNFIMTDGGASICLGDSGGSAYAVYSSGLRRSIVGVNSRGDFNHISFLAPVTFKTILTLLKLLSPNAVQICGIDNMPPGKCHA